MNTQLLFILLTIFLAKIYVVIVFGFKSDTPTVIVTINHNTSIHKIDV